MASEESESNESKESGSKSPPVDTADSMDPTGFIRAHLGLKKPQEAPAEALGPREAIMIEAEPCHVCLDGNFKLARYGRSGQQAEEVALAEDYEDSLGLPHQVTVPPLLLKEVEDAIAGAQAPTLSGMSLSQQLTCQ